MTIRTAPTSRLALGALVAAAVWLLTAASGASGTQDQPAWLRIDDMLFDTSLVTTVPADDHYRTQAFPAFFAYASLPYDFGVVPVELPADLAADRSERFWQSAALWSRAGPIVFVPRTTQSTYVAVTTTQPTCYSAVGRGLVAGARPFSMNNSCWAASQVVHEIGHVLGLAHEHQRPDRDDYIGIDASNIQPAYSYAILDKLRTNFQLGPYDFRSTMHYPDRSYVIDSSKPNIVAHPPYAAFQSVMGRATVPSDDDLADIARQYGALLQPTGTPRPVLPVQTLFSRAEFLAAMERLHALYMSPLGLNRQQGLSIDGKPDFLGLAQWIFDIYLGARSQGFNPAGAFDIVVAAITQTDEWKVKHPGQPSLTPASFSPYIRFDRDEFLATLQRLDGFYASQDGLQRPNGLSIANGPDFLGIATWVFDIYLSERLRGTSPNAAWILVENAIKSTDEWRRKH